MVSVQIDDNAVSEGLAYQARNAMIQTTKRGIALAILRRAILYTPDENYSGTDTIRYQVSDLAGIPSNEAPAVITIVPIVDDLCFRASDHSRLLLNIGGMANVTWVPAAGAAEPAIAADTDDPEAESIPRGLGDYVAALLAGRTAQPPAPGPSFEAMLADHSYASR